MRQKHFEIERKFLVKQIPDDLNNLEKLKIVQGYISTFPVLRIRQSNEKYFFTFKGYGSIKRLEFEEEITKSEFENLKEKVEGNFVEKTRYIIPLENNLKAELDVYDGIFSGVFTVEIEFENLEDAKSFKIPHWFGEEVTENEKYTNAYMSKIIKNGKYLK